MADKALQLGKDFRLFVANTDTKPATDTAYTVITNENDLNVKFSVDAEVVATKEAGRITLPGDVDCEIKFEFNEAFQDGGLALAEDSLNEARYYQIRAVAGTDTVWIEGEFTLTDLEYKAGVKGLREGSGTLKNSGDIKRSRPTRALLV